MNDILINKLSEIFTELEKLKEGEGYTFNRIVNRIKSISLKHFSQSSYASDIEKILRKVNDSFSGLKDRHIIELMGVVQIMIDDLELSPNTSSAKINAKPIESKLDKSKVFIVHGHDDALKNEIARFIDQLGLKPIILHEQPSSSKTIIEKIEDYSNVGYGIVLYTPCDEGAKKGEELKGRARQNVVFEHGFLIGKIRRENVCAIIKDNVEKPNDISGIVYIHYSGNWKMDLIQELKKSGYEVNAEQLFKEI
ncbi:MAG: hypothetical protein VR77_00275 [Flavobacteriales bacterium BRH_c54]|nr:MAG: hypothetical protein VR77_00275 [Flavobacteriales bacterium BRH_c54]